MPIMLSVLILCMYCVPVHVFARTTIPIVSSTGALTPTVIEASKWTAFVSWSQNAARIGIEYWPLVAHTATLTFAPKPGYTLSDIDIARIAITGAQRTTVTNERTLTAVFPNTLDLKPVLVYSSVCRRFGCRIMPTLTQAKLIARTATTEQWIDARLLDYEQRLSAQMQTYDQVVLPIIRDQFGTLPDVDGNGTVDVYATFLPQGQLGYVSYADQQLDAYRNGNAPNFGETIYLDDSVVAGQNTFFQRVLVHELQHIANRRWSDLWLNEGLSEAASHVYFTSIGIPGLQENITAFNNHPERYTRNVTDWRNDSLSYAKSYLFVQYIRTRIEAKYGRNAVPVYRELLALDQGVYDSEDAVALLVRKYVHPSYTFDAFVYEFEQALQRKDATGPYGFNGESFFAQLR
jgi:hypothetical protein